MIVHRFNQKTFTRGEQKAIWELLRKTKGLRTLNFKNPRDVFRANQAVNAYNRWVTGNGAPSASEIKEIKTFLRNSGLGRSEAELDHVLNKYGNKRALARWNRRRLSTRYSKDPEILKIKRDRGHKKNIESDQKARHRELFVSEYKPAFSQANSKYMQGKENSSLLQGLDKEIKRRGNIYHLKNATRNNGVGRDYAILDTFGGIQKPQKFKVNIKEGITSNGEYLGFPKNSSVIVTGRKGTQDPFTVSHELGHVMNSRNPKTKVKGVFEELDNNVTVGSKGKGLIDHNYVRDLNTTAQHFGRESALVAEENAATSRGLAMLKRLGATPEQLAKAKIEGKNALDTYALSAKYTTVGL